MVGILDPACELLPPWTEELQYTCVLLHLYLLSDILPPPSPVDHILQEIYTLFLTRFRTYKIASPHQTKWPVKTSWRDLVSLKFFRPCPTPYQYHPHHTPNVPKLAFPAGSGGLRNCFHLWGLFKRGYTTQRMRWERGGKPIPPPPPTNLSTYTPQQRRDLFLIWVQNRLFGDGHPQRKQDRVMTLAEFSSSTEGTEIPSTENFGLLYLFSLRWKNA